MTLERFGCLAALAVLSPILSLSSNSTLSASAASGSESGNRKQAPAPTSVGAAQRSVQSNLVTATQAASAPSEASRRTAPRIKRELVADLERIIEGRILKADAVDPFDILVSPQGVYLDGYGIVFTAQLNLIVSPTINPFRQVMSKEEIGRVRARKLARLPLLKEMMQQALISSAASLDPVPPDQQVVLSITLFHFSWEDVNGLPQQLVMHAERNRLLDRANARAAIRIEEYE